LVEVFGVRQPEMKVIVMKYKTVLGLFLIVFLVQFSCKAPERKVKPILTTSITIYKEHWDDSKEDQSVSAIAFRDNKLYYLKNDTLLMTYKPTPIKNAKRFTNNGLLQLLQKVNPKTLRDNGNCNDCMQHSKDDFVFRFASEKGVEEIVLPGGFTCDSGSPCIILQVINEAFGSFEH
jgi:hypothetical protein